MSRSEAQVERLEPIGVLVKQVAQIRGGPVSSADGQEQLGGLLRALGRRKEEEKD
jgi:hypothetical protein